MTTTRCVAVGRSVGDGWSIETEPGFAPTMNDEQLITMAALIEDFIAIYRSEMNGYQSQAVGTVRSMVWRVCQIPPTEMLRRVEARRIDSEVRRD